MSTYKIKRFAKVEDYKRIVDENSKEVDPTIFGDSIKEWFGRRSDSIGLKDKTEIIPPKSRDEELKVIPDELRHRVLRRIENEGYKTVKSEKGTSYNNSFRSPDNKGWEDLDSESDKYDEISKSKKVKFNPSDMREALKEDKPFIAHKGDSNTEQIAHELGHAIDERDGVLGKFRYKPGRQDKWADAVNKTGTSASTGFVSGLLAGIYDNKDKDKRSSKHGLVRAGILAAPHAVTLGGNSIRLINERNASKNGLRILKEEGISASDYTKAKKSLKAAYGSYLVDPAIAMAKTAGSQALGYGLARGIGSITKKLNRKKSKKKDKDSKESN